MNWDQAIVAMMGGAMVRRQRDCWERVLERCEVSGDPIIVEQGTEGCILAHAWTHDNKPVRVLMGAESKALFVPDSDHLAAQDWVIIK